MTSSEPLDNLRLVAMGRQPCPYLHDRPAEFNAVDPRLPLSPPRYEILLTQGFRRGGEYIYRPACPGCQACQSLRIPVNDFRARRRHRRCLRVNADVSIHNVGFRYRNEHFALYQRYVVARHPGGGMDDADPDLYWQYLTSSWCKTDFLELRRDDQLLGVAVTDDTGHSLSAVYTFFDPRITTRSLGTLAILLQLEVARQRQRQWLYLGYWIQGAPKMHYKADFCPHERFTPSGWKRHDAFAGINW